MSLPVFGPFVAGALEIVNLDCSTILATGETITAVKASIRVADNSSVADATASTLLRGASSFSGSVVSAWLGGGPLASTQFAPGAVYLLAFQIATSLGRTTIAESLVTVSPTAPATGWT